MEYGHGDMQGRALIGCLLGTAVGDALGLPYEGMTGSRGGRMFPDRDRLHFLPGYGMVSDDTEHACFTAQAVIRSQGDPDRFERELARSLRWWLAGLPAGIGFATLRSILRLWIGIPPERSGVFSAGNGPAMRSPLLGLAFGDRPERMKETVFRSTRMTHTDPKALHGALATALAAFLSSKQRIVEPQEFLRIVRDALPAGSNGEFIGLVGQACGSAERGEAVPLFAESIGSRNGISGYMYHTVPCVIQTWLRHQKNYETGVKEIIAAGGDTDTTAAILGGIIGAGVGREGIPEQWLSRIREWPRSIVWMENLGKELHRSLSGDRQAQAPAYATAGIAPRNVLFLLVVLAHGVRRMLPPY